MIRRLATVAARLLVVIFIVKLADVPILCAEELPSPRNSVAADGIDASGRSGQAAPVGIAVGTDKDPLACVCRLNFCSTSGTELAYSGISVSLDLLPAPARVSAPPRALDHPPQNLL